MKKWMYNALIILFAAIFVGSTAYLAIYFINSNKQAKQNAGLQQLHQTQTSPRPVITGDGTVTPSETPPAFVEVTDPETGETVKLLPEFKDLYLMNNDIVGWLKIPGMDVDYPVMQTPEEADYYLKRDFYKEYSQHGSLYVREVCDVNTPSDNVIIYGHRMRDGSMFGKLEKYVEKSYFEENPYIYFDTLTELHTYQIIAVFKTTVTKDNGFDYYTFVNAAGEEEFNEYVSTCQELALYNTGETAQYGEKLITLSTCEYSQANGRLVVVAKRIA